MTDYRRDFTAKCGFFFERPQNVQQGDGFRNGSTHPTSCEPKAPAPQPIVTPQARLYSRPANKIFSLSATIFSPALSFASTALVSDALMHALKVIASLASSMIGGAAAITHNAPP